MKKSLALTGFLVGTIVSVQLNSRLIAHRDTDIHEKKDLKEILRILKNEQDLLKNEIQEKRKEENKKLKFLAGNIQSELDQVNKEAGFTEVKGSGIIINLAGSTDTIALVSDLRKIVNFLFSINTEGVAVNGYRVVFKTPIISVGESILLKKFNIVPPFEIKVIGNADFILSALETNDSLADLRKKVLKEELFLEIKKSNLIELPPYFY